MLGEDVVIARAGKPVAKLVRIQVRGRKRILGSAKGTIWYAEDWDGPVNDREFEAFIGG
jgi:antitoxin (DNA-binding transcriptional repressor) of toxin-antitoxin stability system